MPADLYELRLYTIGFDGNCPPDVVVDIRYDADPFVTMTVPNGANQTVPFPPNTSMEMEEPGVFILRLNNVPIGSCPVPLVPRGKQETVFTPLTTTICYELVQLR